LLVGDEMCWVSFAEEGELRAAETTIGDTSRTSPRDCGQHPALTSVPCWADRYPRRDPVPDLPRSTRRGRRRRRCTSGGSSTVTSRRRRPRQPRWAMVPRRRHRGPATLQQSATALGVTRSWHVLHPRKRGEGYTDAVAAALITRQLDADRPSNAISPIPRARAKHDYNARGLPCLQGCGWKEESVGKILRPDAPRGRHRRLTPRSGSPWTRVSFSRWAGPTIFKICTTTDLIYRAERIDPTGSRGCLTALSDIEVDHEADEDGEAGPPIRYGVR